jgi:hypothetical protein
LSKCKNLRKNLRSNLCSNLRSNLRSNLYNNLYNNIYNNLDLQIASLISNNSYLFLYKYLINFRRFSIEEDPKTSIVPKVAIGVATNII